MYALDGNIDRVSESIYLCAPNNMSVSRENYEEVKETTTSTVDEPRWQAPPQA